MQDWDLGKVLFEQILRPVLPFGGKIHRTDLALRVTDKALLMQPIQYFPIVPLPRPVSGRFIEGRQMHQCQNNLIHPVFIVFHPYHLLSSPGLFGEQKGQCKGKAKRAVGGMGVMGSGWKP